MGQSQAFVMYMIKSSYFCPSTEAETPEAANPSAAGVCLHPLHPTTKCGRHDGNTNLTNDSADLIVYFFGIQMLCWGLS